MNVREYVRPVCTRAHARRAVRLPLSKSLRLCIVHFSPHPTNKQVKSFIKHEVFALLYNHNHSALCTGIHRLLLGDAGAATSCEKPRQRRMCQPQPSQAGAVDAQLLAQSSACSASEQASGQGAAQGVHQITSSVTASGLCRLGR